MNTQTRVDRVRPVRRARGGLVTFEKDLGDEVSPGETLFTITDVFGKLKAEVTADRDGIFWRSRRLPQVATGEYVCSVGIDINRY